MGKAWRHSAATVLTGALLAWADPEATDNGVRKAGVVHVVYGGGKGTLTISQSDDNVPGAPEGGDQYGYSLAVYDADLDGCSDLVVGTPYEDVGTAPDAGSVHVIYGSTSGLNAGSKSVKEFQQGSGKPLGDAPEAGDWLGYAVAAGKSSNGAPYLLIGGPGESVGTVEDAGGLMSGVELEKRQFPELTSTTRSTYNSAGLTMSKTCGHSIVR